MYEILSAKRREDVPGKPVTGVQCMTDLTLPVIIVSDEAGAA